MELARRVAELFAQPRRRERLAALGRARVKQEYSGSIMLAAYRQLYLAALEAAPPLPAGRFPTGADGGTFRSSASSRGHAARRPAR